MKKKIQDTNVTSIFTKNELRNYDRSNKIRKVGLKVYEQLIKQLVLRRNWKCQIVNNKIQKGMVNFDIETCET